MKNEQQEADNASFMPASALQKNPCRITAGISLI
jgi:hypothetical protein